MDMSNVFDTDLMEENLRLKAEISDLKARLSFLERHPTLVAGMHGERLVSQALNGRLTGYSAAHDVEATGTGALIEVKYSKLNRPVRGVPTRRWAWSKILGEGGAKQFDYLLLIGDTDRQYSHFYKDTGSPYVFFLVPYDRVRGLMMSTGRSHSIQLTTNPVKAKSAAAPLFKDFQVSIDELQHLGL